MNDAENIQDRLMVNPNKLVFPHKNKLVFMSKGKAFVIGQNQDKGNQHKRKSCIYLEAFKIFGFPAV